MTGTTIQYALEDGTPVKAHVLSSHMKHAGKLKNGVNVQMIGKKDPVLVDWNQVKW